jgi:hypothetical protein
MSIRVVSFGFAAALLAASALVPAPVSAAPGVVMNHATDVALLQLADYQGKRRWWRAWDDEYDGETHVRAPTTSVDTNEANTDVEAPFTSVHKTPRGTWIRAPFVNLFVPRD